MTHDSPWTYAEGDVETYRRKLLRAFSPDRLALIALADPDAMAYLPGQRPLDADERDVYMDYVLSQAVDAGLPLRGFGRLAIPKREGEAIPGMAEGQQAHSGWKDRVEALIYRLTGRTPGW